MDENPILKYFNYDHLGPNLAEISRRVHDLARFMDSELVDGPQKEIGLQRLLEAKDCFARAKLG